MAESYLLNMWILENCGLGLQFFFAVFFTLNVLVEHDNIKYVFNKAYENGFDCLGYPNEIAKRISMDEYDRLVVKNGKMQFDHI